MSVPAKALQCNISPTSSSEFKCINAPNTLHLISAVFVHFNRLKLHLQHYPLLQVKATHDLPPPCRLPIKGSIGCLFPYSSSHPQAPPSHSPPFTGIKLFRRRHSATVQGDSAMLSSPGASHHHVLYRALLAFARAPVMCRHYREQNRAVTAMSGTVLLLP